MWFYILYISICFIYFANKSLYSESYGFSSNDVWMWKLDHKEGWVLKNWCFRTVVPEKTFESSLDCKGIKLVNPKGNQPWILTGMTDAKAEAPILRPPDAKRRLTGKDPDDGKDWRQEEKGITEAEVVGWHHWLCGHEFEQALGDGEEQGSLVCCSPWGCKELDTTEWLKNNLFFIHITLHIIYVIYFYIFCIYKAMWVNLRPNDKRKSEVHVIEM